jgi:hypothetical protein
MEAHMQIQVIPGKMESSWHDDVKAVVDTWTTYNVTLDEFKEAVLVKGVRHAKANGGRAWIVDSSSAEGAFSSQIQQFIGSEVFPAFVSNGIKYFITINSRVSLQAKDTVATYSAKAGPNGLKLLEVGSVSDAMAWLKANP